MGFQAVAFFLAFALPVAFMDRISDKRFKLSTKRTLTIIAVCLGALPLVLVSFSGGFLHFIQAIRIAYLVFAVLVVVVADRVHAAATRAKDCPPRLPSAED